MLIGTVAAIGTGMSTPMSFLFLGDLIKAFTFNALTEGISIHLFNETVCCDNKTLAVFVKNLSTPENAITCVDDGTLIATVDFAIYKLSGAAVGTFLCACIQIFFYQMACERQLYKIRLYYYRAILRQDIGWFDSNPSGELASRLNDDLDKLHDGIGDKLSYLIQFIATFFGGLVISFLKSWKLAASLTAKAQKQYASAGAVAEEVLSSIRTVVALGGEDKECARYNQHLNKAGRIGIKKGFANGALLAVVFFLFYALYAVIFWFGGYLISIRELNSGDLMTAFFALVIGAFALGQAAPNAESLMTAAGSSVSIYETIDRVPPIDSASDEGEILENFDSSLEFKDIKFKYPTRPDVQILKGFNLKVPVGKTVALVGPSGCGKSTVIQLLQRFYDPSGGEVCVGGRNIRTLNLKWLRRHIGLVSQEPVLFDTTIAENIRFGRQDATLSDIEKAAREANVHDFIASLPNGYDTLVGERGVQLSGGQKQRVAIARALVRDPKLLLLDEATSALDTESESVVQEALDKARSGRTTIVIAHRLSTIQNADLIIAIEEGQVAEMGTHAELIQQKGLYFNLVVAQQYGDIDVTQLSLAPCKFVRSNSVHSTARHRHNSGSELETSFSCHQSLNDRSVDSKSSRLFSSRKALEEQWDKETPAVPLSVLLKKNAPEWWMIGLGLVGSLVAGSITPVFTIFFGKILSIFANPPDKVFHLVHPWAGVFLALAVVTGISNLSKAVCFTVAGERLTSRLRSESFRAMLMQEISWFDEKRNSTGVLVTRLANDAAQVEGATGTRLGMLLESSFGLLLSLVIAALYSWVLTLVILCFVPIMMATGILQMKGLTAHVADYKVALENAGKLATDSIQNIRTVASLGVEGVFVDLYKKETRKPYQKALKNSLVNGLTYGFSQGAVFFGYVIAYRFGAYLVTLPANHILHANFSDIFVVLFALVFGAMAAGQAGAFAPNYAKARLSANRIFALLNRLPATSVCLSEEGARPDKLNAAITVENVTFQYPSRPEVQVLNGLSVSLNPGQTLALVGPSGCGKSTMVSLLERFYEPNSGCLKLDQQDIRDLNIRWLRQNIGLVSQEPILFDSSIADNIRYGANFREVCDAEIIAAAKAANIHNFIETLPEGYNTNVGAKGTQLSGGQKQRIAIARALVRNPRILLLDEATSALDTESEKVVQEALDKAREGRTSIVIAHRLSTIYNADVIAVIKGGQVAESGTHQELMKMKGLYYKLNRYQILIEEPKLHMLEDGKEKSEDQGIDLADAEMSLNL
ncbi:hypothetical protein EMCRGX_G002482 [Ephydatia muelleri]